MLEHMGDRTCTAGEGAEVMWKTGVIGEALQGLVKKKADWTPTMPLIEDRHLQGFVPLSAAHSSLKFDMHQPRLNLESEAVLRICCLRRFAYDLADMDTVAFSYAAEESAFYGPIPRDPAKDEKEAQQKLAEAESRRNQLMRDMAQLRLKTEVRQLEGKVQSKEAPASLPPYLVPDASALTDSLNHIQQLAQSARFIITIPLAVIEQLDYLKKEGSGARDAIRWLEAEFKKGSRYVRAQKNHETVSLNQPKVIKKRDRDTWRFMQLLACCSYLSQQGSLEQARGMVALLTNLDSNDALLPLRLRQLLVTTKQDGIVMHKPAEFYRKWKDVWKTDKG